MSGEDLLAFGVVALLVGAHLVPPRLAFIRFTSRSWVLSAAGGVSVAYVFVHLLPEIAEAQATVEASASTVLAGAERHAYVLALIGLAVFYGLERAAITSKAAGRMAEGSGRDQEEVTTPGAFWLSTVSFGAYNAIIGYLVVRRAEHAGTVDLAVSRWQSPCTSSSTTSACASTTVTGTTTSAGRSWPPPSCLDGWPG